MSKSKVIEINSLEDLEDQVDILKSLSENLKKAGLARSELEVYMNEYIILEDTIHQGIKILDKSLKIARERQAFDGQIELFNTLTCDFQDSWNDEYWACYEMIREGDAFTKKVRNSDEQINRLQNLAIILNKDSKDDKKEESKALEEVDELSKKYKPGNHSEPINRKCCDCLIM